MEKLTKRDVFERVIGIVKEANVADAAALVEKLEHEIELLDNKKGRQSKVKEENVNIMEFVYAELARIGKATVTEIARDEAVAAYKMENGEAMSAAKITYILTQLKKDGRVERIEEKGKAYYTVIGE